MGSSGKRSKKCHSKKVSRCQERIIAKPNIGLMDTCPLLRVQKN